MTTATEQRTESRPAEPTITPGNTKKRTNPVLERLRAIRDAVDFALSEESVRARLQNVEVTEEILREGRRLSWEAAVLTVWQSVLFRRKFAEARELEHLQARARQAYWPIFRLARMVFGNDPELSRKLMLRGRRSDSVGGEVRRMSAFYGYILTEDRLVARLESYGCTAAELRCGSNTLRDFADALASGEEQNDARERATRKRNAALRRAYEWRDTFQGIVDTVFIDSPDILSKLRAPQ